MDFWRDTGGGDNGDGGSDVSAIPNVVDWVDASTVAGKSGVSLRVLTRPLGARLVSMEPLRNRHRDKCFSLYRGIITPRKASKTKLSHYRNFASLVPLVGRVLHFLFTAYLCFCGILETSLG